MRQIISLLQPTVPRVSRSLQVVACPCCEMILPDVIPQVFPWMSGSASRWICWVLLSVPSPTTSAFPENPQQVGIHIRPLSNFRVGTMSQPSSFLRSNLQVCSPPRSLLPLENSKGSCGFYIQAHHAPACFGYATRLFRTIDGTETFTPLDSQSCRPLRIPSLWRHYSPSSLGACRSNDLVARKTRCGLRQGRRAKSAEA